MTSATAGLAWIRELIFSVRSRMAGHEMSAAAWIGARTWLMSSSGKKPLGISLYSHTVMMQVPSASSSISQRRLSVQFRLLT